MEWNDETISRLRALWDEGHSTAEIGRRLGVSKNAVVGKAHRMTLPARPSPIRRDGAAAPRSAAPRRVTGPTLPPFPASCLDVPSTAPTRGTPAVPSMPTAAARVALECPSFPAGLGSARPAIPPEPAAPMRVVPPASGRQSACCWPLGDPGTRSFRFCDATSLPGKPYCPEHAQVAYVKVRDRREEAA